MLSQDNKKIVAKDFTITYSIIANKAGEHKHMKTHMIFEIKTTSDLHNEAVDKQLEIYAALLGGNCKIRISGNQEVLK